MPLAAAARSATGVPRAAPTGLAINPPGNRFEVEADRAAERVASPREPGAPRLALARTASLAGVGIPINPRAAAATRALLDSGGTPLDPAVRRIVEPALGHDFSRVRVHTDPAAARAARALAAAAYSVGTHIVFGAGRFAPHARPGLALIAHELAHVVQGGAAGSLIFRAEDEEARPNGVHSIGVAVSVDEAIDPQVFHVLDADGAANLGTLYPGDVVTVTPYDDAMAELAGPFEWEVPPGFTEVSAGAGRIQLRVTSTVPLAAEIGLTDATGRRVALKVSVGELPGQPSVNPEAERVERERGELREARRAERQAFRASRRERRAAPRAERVEARAAHREARREMRQQARTLRRARRELERASACGIDTERVVQRALERGAAVAAAAHAALASRGPADPQIAALLRTCLHWSPDPAQPDATARVVARVLDTLAVARNSMLVATGGLFACTGGCDETSGAFVTQNSRGGVVTLCQKWTSGTGLRFAAATALSEARAYALLHEFVHLSGPGADPEIYFGGGDWTALTGEQALGMADAYAAFAWKLAGGGGAT